MKSQPSQKTAAPLFDIRLSDKPPEGVRKGAAGTRDWADSMAASCLAPRAVRCRS